MSKRYPNTKVAYYTEHTKTGIPKYLAEIRHTGLEKHRAIRDSDNAVLRNKVEAQLLQWHRQWEKQRHLLLSKDKAKQDSLAAQQALSDVEAFLVSRLDRATKLTPRSKLFAFMKTEPVAPKPEARPRRPAKKKHPMKPSFVPSLEPEFSHAKYPARYGIRDWFSRSAREATREIAKSKYRYDLLAWESSEDLRRQNEEDNWQLRCTAIDRENQDAFAKWEKKCLDIKTSNEERRQTYRAKHEKWQQSKSKHDNEVAGFFEKYKTRDPETVKKYISTIFGRLRFPSWFEHECEIFFDPETKVAGLDFRLPEPAELPTLREVVYVQSRDQFSEKSVTTKERDSLYDSLIYQVALLTLHMCFRSTLDSVLSSVVFNGCVHTRDASTGKKIRPYIISVHAKRSEFESVDLRGVDPKECFRKLRGVGNPRLHLLAPIPLVLTFNKKDARFIEGRDVAGHIDEGTNIAAMPWDDFEHLIRELFEKMFAERGMEVKVTQQSRDRGVDAIAFDPDPITGGKYVLQAKRYTNVVPAAAVRELEGTVSGERASLGILVTTSSFGPEAIKWAADKPLRLIDGSNLLHLLQQHGHRAYIDLEEAKEIHREEERKRTKRV